MKATKNMRKERKFIYFYYGRAIPRAIFINNVPKNWQNKLDKYGTYSWGGYKAYTLE